MVSNSLKIELQELLDQLERVSTEFSADPEYLELRGSLPEDWPL